MEDDQEIGAFMFRRTVPSIHLIPEDIHLMVDFSETFFVISIQLYLEFTLL